MTTPAPTPEPVSGAPVSKPKSETPEAKPAQAALDSRILWIAVGLLGVYVLGMLLMYASRASNEITWSRLVFLYGGLEAIAFAAAGYLFGREVNRARAETAEARADEAQAESKEAKQEAARAGAEAENAKEKGKTLANFISSRVAPEGAATGDRETFGRQAGRVTPDDIRAIHDLANQLFP